MNSQNCSGLKLLGGSWVVISGVISRVTIHIRGLITLLITTHEPPSKDPKRMHAGVGYCQEALARPVSGLAGKDTAHTAACPASR